MARRRPRRRDDDDQEGLGDLMAEAAVRWPVVGFSIGGASLTVALYLILINPKWMLGLGSLAGILFLIGGICFVLLGVGGLVKAKILARIAGRRLHGAWTIQRVHDMTWSEFERTIADLYRRQGYAVEEVGRAAQERGTGDGGVDLILTRPDAPGAQFLVQCKHYRAWQVGEPALRDFYGAMAAARAQCEGIFVTCGRFTDSARTFASGKPIELVDGESLLRLLNQFNSVTPDVAGQANRPLPPGRMPAPQPAEAITPVCPRCQVPMVRRIATRGSNQGRPFWGCSNYPRCKQIINIA